MLTELKPKGVIFLGGSSEIFEDNFASIDIPSVVSTLVNKNLHFPNLSMVGVDDKKSGGLAVEHLIANGHRKIAILGGYSSSTPSISRYEGALETMAKHGIVFDEKNLYGRSNYTFEDAYNAMNAMLAKRAEFTALFAMSDTIAIGAMRALIDAGYNIPQDISVIGFDGITLSRFTNPSLVTVHQPADLICKKSVSLLVSQIERRKIGQTIVLEADILSGDSVRKL